MEALAEEQLTSRLLAYALISDAAVSFLMKASPRASDLDESLRIVGVKSITMISRIGSGMNIRDGKEYGRATANVLDTAAVPKSEVTKLFANNTFVPVKLYRESSAGFSRQQMYLDNVERVGHCLACDPILNLVDFDQGRRRVCYILAAEAEGHASAVLLTR
jgi:3-oxoacyl-[acyl-carrier-protein] synthase-3